MPSLSDIPAELVDKERREDFVHWLVNMPLDISNKRGILRIWILTVGRPVTPEQFAFISRTALK